MWERLFRRGRHVEPVATAPSRVGLVFGGGVLRGAAHLGVLHVLEEVGIRPAVVVGTSVGAVIGAGVAAGVPADQMWQMFRTLNWTQVARPSWGSKLSMFDSGPIGVLISRVTPAAAIEHLELPFAAIACDLITGDRVVLTEGDLHRALAGSSAMPGVFEPVRRGKQMLIDGGIIDNLPVDVAQDLGADYVIAVDIMPALDGSMKPKDVRDVIVMAWNIVEHNTAYSRDHADIVISPNVAGVNLTDFKQIDAAYEAGIAAAEAALPEILGDLGRV